VCSNRARNEKEIRLVCVITSTASLSAMRIFPLCNARVRTGVTVPYDSVCFEDELEVSSTETSAPRRQRVRVELVVFTDAKSRN
jgi:hypothetical protein